MPSRLFPLTTLSELADGQEADFFALLSAKSEATTRDGKPYWRVTFRDALREVSFPLWSDSGFATACKDEWKVGECYKLRAIYAETKFGPQLELKKVRPVIESDKADGFDPWSFLPRSKFDSAAMFQQLVGLAKSEIAEQSLRALTVELLEQNKEVLLRLPAARRNHHPFVGGWLEHVLSVTRNAIFLADKYAADYPELQPPLARDVVVAGAILHDIGKVHELSFSPAGAEYSPAGELIGHILIGRDMVREAAQRHPLSPETLLRLEHVVVSHQRLPEWGSPKPPMTPEAILVHFADDVDAKFQTAMAALAEPGEGPLTSSRNPLQHRIFRGLGE
ncbi:MAG TPA: HD domain-containing protein [Pirellulaceae bacterium]|nr:HD domain-containing protein [Pirellulaceae bacterium]